MKDRSQSVNRFLARRGLVEKIEGILGINTEKEIKKSKTKKQKAKRGKRSRLKHKKTEKY